MCVADMEFTPGVESKSFNAMQVCKLRVRRNESERKSIDGAALSSSALENRFNFYSRSLDTYGINKRRTFLFLFFFSIFSHPRFRLSNGFATVNTFAVAVAAIDDIGYDQASHGTHQFLFTQFTASKRAHIYEERIVYGSGIFKKSGIS